METARMQEKTRIYLDKHGLGRRYRCHPNSVPRRVREKTFPQPTLWLGPASPRWDSAECDRWDDLLSLTGDPRSATAQVLAERTQRLAPCPAGPNVHASKRDLASSQQRRGDM